MIKHEITVKKYFLNGRIKKYRWLNKNRIIIYSGKEYFHRRRNLFWFGITGK